MNIFKQIKFLISVLILVLLPGCSWSMNKPVNQIILLNGTSSSGKSSIIRELLLLLKGITEVISFDQTVGEVYEIVRKKISNERGGIAITDADIESYFDAMDSQTRTHACEEMEAQVFLAMCTKVRENFKAGKNVILDILIETKHEADLFLKPLHDLPVCMVLAYCPLKALLQHLLDRNASSDETEHRDLTPPFEQFFNMYKKQATASDLKVDTLGKPQVEWVFAEMTRIANEQEKQPDALAKFLDYMSKRPAEVYKKFELDSCEEVIISPELNYDLVVNSGVATSAECAHKIVDFLAGKPQLQALQKNYELLQPK